MKQLDKCWNAVKKKSPTILAIVGSLGTGVTAYLAAKNEAKYQKDRFEYYLGTGYFPEEFGGVELSKDELRKKGYAILGKHLKQHATTFVAGGITIGSILGGNAAGKKQYAALTAMNIGVGNMLAQRKENESKIVESKITKEEIQDYLVQEAYNNDLVYYTNLETLKEDEKFIWLDIFPTNKIFVVRKDDVISLPWIIDRWLKEVGYISYGEIFDCLNIYCNTAPDFYDEDINEWVYMYGFSREPDNFRKIEVYSREVQVDKDVTVTAISFSEIGKPIDTL